MKKLLAVLTVVGIMLVSPAFAAGNTVNVVVNGLVCEFCAKALEKVFGEEEAVESVAVDLDTKIVSILMKEDQNLEDEAITELINDSGYSVREIRRDDE